MPVSADDDHLHSVTITSTSVTNFAAPDSILPNGSATYRSTYTYTPALQPVQATDPNSKTTTNAYDSFGRLQTSTIVTNMVTTYTYDSSQHTVSASAHNTGWIVGTPDHWQRTTTDGFGRTIKTEAGDSSNSILSIVDTRYAPCACSPLGKNQCRLRALCSQRDSRLDPLYLRRQRPHPHRHRARWREHHQLYLPRQPDHHHRPRREVEDLHLRRQRQPPPGDRTGQPGDVLYLRRSQPPDPGEHD